MKNDALPMDNDFIIVEKVADVAFLSLKKLHCIPFVKPDGRVAFKVSGDVSGALAELSRNPSVPILDYIQRLNTVKSIIFTMKDQRC